MSYKLIVASAHHVPEIPDKSIHLICSSPPYFNLRQYQGAQAIEWPEVSYSPIAGMPEITIPGCEPGCVHEWADGPTKTQQPQRDHDSNGNFGDTRGTESSRQGMAYKVTQGAYCQRCGGWAGSLGLEPTIEAFIGHLILVLREMHRVLRDDGSIFFNLGDSYTGSGGAHTLDHANPGISKSAHRNGATQYKADGGRGKDKKVKGLKPRNLMGIPARFHLAAQAEGWVVHTAMPWIKRNSLPDSTPDRPGCAVESVFMLSKNGKHFFDMEAVRVPHRPESLERWKPGTPKVESENSKNAEFSKTQYGKTRVSEKSGDILNPSGRNLRAADLFFKTWEGMLLDDCGDPMAMVINPKGYSGSHFAAFAPEIPETCILAGTSAAGVCPHCGKQWVRCVERMGETTTEKRQRLGLSKKRGTGGILVVQDLDYAGGHGNNTRQTTTTGWAPSCSCPPHTPIPATVCDFFSGSGTTGMVCNWLGRDYVGVDLSDEYHALAHERINTPRERIENKREPMPGQMGLFA